MEEIYRTSPLQRKYIYYNNVNQARSQIKYLFLLYTNRNNFDEMDCFLDREPER